MMTAVAEHLQTPPQPGIRHLLIDLGGVLYEIEIARTVDAYNAMRAPGAPPIDFGKASQHDMFTALDLGTVDIEAFAAGLRDAYQLQGSLEEIIDIWRRLLIGVLPQRAEMLRALRAAGYSLALLSNTSRYHYSCYREACEPMFSQMDHLFFSFDLALRKPDPAIYHKALELAGWKAGETLFLDDSLTNIESARQAGLHVWWVREHEDFDRMVAAYVAANA
ncbi:MAG: HAD family phosphatase [Bacteroidia bacterium]|nr:HAD family phosphatase [Bacteroidia bacterium]